MMKITKFKLGEIKMKKLLTLISLAGVLTFAQTGAPGTSGTSVGVSGIVSRNNPLITFGPYNGVNLLFLSGGVYVDSTPATTALTLKRIDNNADSCSNPFFIASDSLEKNGGVWQFRLEALVTTTDGDSSTTAYKIQTRTFDWMPPPYQKYRARPWTQVGKNSGDANTTISDSIIFVNLKKSGVKWSQYGMASVWGTQARVCPERLAGTHGVATDTTKHDSLRVFRF